MGMRLTDAWDRASALDWAGQPLSRWLLAAAVAAGVFIVLRGGVAFALRQLARLADRTRHGADDVAVQALQGTRSWLLAVLALLAGAQCLTWSVRGETVLAQAWFVALVVQLALWLSRALSLLLTRHLASHAHLAQSGASATLLSWGLRVVLWTTVVLAVLSNMGMDITAMVASLGIGGVAVALAVQNVLGDLFASLSIAMDKPFEVGDAIAVNGLSGTVERVGLKTTRIRALGGEQLVIANADLLKNVVSNYKRQQTRRIAFKFAVALDTPAQLAREIPAMVREVVDARQDVRFDRAHLMALGEGALEYEAVYTVQSPDYTLHMDRQQDILLDLIRRLQAAGVRFGVPRTVLGLPGAFAPAVRP
ncbi:mechanosensitive ion channel family protein [Ideonella sp.]|uniref:mechanosensitive ion channel family protein n=1 Tax=Ideonella sp. TaxID=1929293 RepID=UPI0035B1779F